MAIFESKKVQNLKNSAVVQGDYNIVTVSQRISETTETNVTNEGKKWHEVVNQITSLQRLLRDVPDEFEHVRDQHLVPSASRAKMEAAKLKEDPNGEKKGFLDAFKSVCDSIGRVVDVAAKASPIIVTIANLIGIPLPPLPTK